MVRKYLMQSIARPKATFWGGISEWNQKCMSVLSTQKSIIESCRAFASDAGNGANDDDDPNALFRKQMEQSKLESGGNRWVRGAKCMEHCQRRDGNDSLPPSLVEKPVEQARSTRATATSDKLICRCHYERTNNLFQKLHRK